MSDKKGVLTTLRKKRSDRPKISAPIPGGLPSNPGPKAKPPSNAGGQRLDVPRPRLQQQNTNTVDLVKRRYSTRYTLAPADFGAGAPPVPGIPQIPKQFAPNGAGPESRPTTSSERRIKVDVDALRDPNLRPEQYVASILADASDQDIRTFQQDLQKVKNRTSTDLQFNVYQNRTQFIKISKEAEKLKSEMRTLKTLMSELTNTLGDTASVNGLNTDTVRSRKQANRSSVANLEALWNTHLQALWKRVEGSQKYLPAIPGRHVVYESSRWAELNAATYKVRRRVWMILLNDHLLVATEKKRADASTQSSGKQRDKTQGQLSALRCWPLADIKLKDLSEKSEKRSGDRVNADYAINVILGTEQWTFAASMSGENEKPIFLSNWRKTTEDLRRLQEAESEERQRTRKSVDLLNDVPNVKRTTLRDSLSEDAANKTTFTIDVDGKQQSVRWIEGQLDDLDIDIALQRFEEAVQRVEDLRKLVKGIKGNTIAQEYVTTRVNERAAKLASSLVKQVVETNSWKDSTHRNVDWLVRLGFEERAREAYLNARSELLRKRVRQCIFGGNIYDYIYQVSYIYFTIIRNTASTFQNCFPPAMMSACVKWAKGHVDDFNVILARQLGGLDDNSEVRKECMERALKHAGMLSEVGLDFRHQIGMNFDETMVA